MSRFLDLAASRRHPELPLGQGPACETLEQKFAAYDKDNPEVYAWFKVIVLDHIRNGAKYISPRDLAPEVRRLVGHGVNNSYWRFYADKFKAEKPYYAHLFRERKRPEKAMRLVYAK